MQSLTLEGLGSNQLLQKLRSYGQGKDVNLEIATVISAPPSLQIKLDNSSLVLDNDDLIVAEHLTVHTRKVSIPSLNVSNVDMMFNDTLKVNDRVILASIGDAQTYVIIDRSVIY